MALITSTVKLTPEQMFAAMQELVDYHHEVCLYLRRPEYMWRPTGKPSWYVSVTGVEIKDGNVLRGGCSEGETPYEAIEDQWRVLTELKPSEYLVVHAMNPAKRRACRWNGSRWAPVEEQFWPARGAK